MIKILSNVIQYVLSDEEVEDTHTIKVYNKTKEKFLALLNKRFFDKSALCRAKVIKVFIKLTEVKVVPDHTYQELFH